MTHALPLTVLAMCEDAFDLNVLTREHRLQSVFFRDFYELKKQLIKYLYLHSYAIEVVQHKQEHPCWTCNGEGCFRCDDTGIHHVSILYSFLFDVRGHKFKWHQPQREVDYEVTLTGPILKPYNAPPAKPYVQMTSRRELLIFLRLWFSLFIRRAPLRLKMNWKTVWDKFFPKTDSYPF